MHFVAGTKGEIVNKLKEDDLKICTLFNKIISMNQFHTLLNQCGPAQISAVQQQEILATLTYRNQRISVPRSVVRNFHKQVAISTHAMDVIMILFQMRCDRICISYESVHRDEVGYQPIPRTAFVPFSFYSTLCEDPLGFEALEANTVNIVDFRQRYSKWIIPFRFDNTLSEFGMIYIDVDTKHVGIFDPFDGIRSDGTVMSPQEEDNMRVSIQNTLFPFLQRQYPDIVEVDAWTCGFTSYRLLQEANVLANHNAMSHRLDSAIIIAAVLYYVVHESPVFFRAGESLINFRYSLGYWILEGQLPV